MSVSVIDLDTLEIVEIWCRCREPLVTLVFDASDFTKPEKKEQPASKKDEATVKPAEIEVSVPERDQDTEELAPLPASKKEVEAKLHASGETWQAVTQQGREVEAKINQVEAALETLRASNDDRTSHSKKWPAEVSASDIEVVATVKPAEIEVSVPERTPRFLQRESEVCEGLGASLRKNLLKAPALHLAMIFSKPLRPIGAAADGSQQSQEWLTRWAFVLHVIRERAHVSSHLL
jgi:hypothetical protein